MKKKPYLCSQEIMILANDKHIGILGFGYGNCK